MAGYLCLMPLVSSLNSRYIMGRNGYACRLVYDCNKMLIDWIWGRNEEYADRLVVNCNVECRKFGYGNATKIMP